MPVMSRAGLFKKPDGGLRGLLPSEESWSWEKRRDDPEICTRAMEPSETTAISSLGSKVANRPHLLRSQHAADPNDRVPEQQDNSKGPTDRRSGCVAQGGPVRGDLNTDSKAVNPLLSGTQEGSGSMEINMEISEEESLSSRAITKQPLSPTSNDASWKSQKSAGSFPSLAEFQRVSAIRIHISDVSLSSTEIEEDLPFDSESSKWESTDNGGQWGQDVDSPSPGKLSTTSPVCPKESHRAVARLPEETVRHNDQNNQKSQSVFSVNNNHEKKQTSAVAGAEDHQRPSPQACQSISKPLFPTGSFSIRPVASVKEAAIDSLSRSAVSRTKDNSRRCPSSSGEESSDSEDKSAVLSLGSDIQVSSEEEQVPGTGVKKGPAKNDRSLQVSVHERTPGLPSCPDKTHSMESETTQVVGTCPELGSSASEKWMLRKEIIFTRKVEALMTASLASEETLSEILSPVDEVLSYGSAELPPSLAGGLFASLPSPPPAHEIITWTSEDFPPPPEGVVQSQEEEDSLEDDRSIKSEDLPSLTEDLPLPIDECDGAEMMNLTSAGEAPGSLQRKTVAMDSDGITVDPLKTSELPPSPLPNILLAEQEQDTNKDNKSQPFLTLSVVDDSDDSSDPLASFDIGDRVLVFHTKPGTLKFKGLTSFAGGHWAGVALDSPNGHHNGTFKGIQYFECEKNRGVLVRAEDISHLLGEQDSDLDTKANEDPFSDEDPPKNLKSKQEGQKETKSSERSSKGNASERQDHRGHRSISPRMCKNRLSLEEINNNSFHNTCGIMEEVLISEASLSTSESSLMTTNLEEIIYEAARAVEQFARSDSTLDLSLGLDDTDDAADIVYQPSVPSSESLRRESDAEEPKPTQLTYFRQDLDGIPLIGFDKAEEGDAQSIQSGSMNVQSAHSSQQVEKVPSTNGHGYDLELLIDRMAGELLNEVVRDVEKLRKMKQDSRGTVKEDTHSTGPVSM
ncbi:CE350 protein, partial [Amia calva]|nr:CE350 protein [Amia calva]